MGKSKWAKVICLELNQMEKKENTLSVSYYKSINSEKWFLHLKLEFPIMVHSNFTAFIF